MPCWNKGTALFFVGFGVGEEDVLGVGEEDVLGVGAVLGVGELDLGVGELDFGVGELDFGVGDGADVGAGVGAGVGSAVGLTIEEHENSEPHIEGYGLGGHLYDPAFV